MKKPGGGGETVLESRHVVGMFLGVVVICGIFFSLGWVMGRTQTDSEVRAASLANPASPVAAPKPVTGNPAPAVSTDWDYLKSRTGTPEKVQPLAPVTRPAESLSASAGKTTPRSAPGPAVKSAASAKLVKNPVIPQGGMVLQVAALRSEADALALAEALQQKEFPAFVLTPEGSGLFRVQVGPYSTVKSADAARKALERHGFKSIVKR